MAWLFYLLIFAVSCAILYWSGGLVIKSLMSLAKFLGWREFVVAFFVMAAAASLPNLFVGLTSVFQGIPVLSLGDILGNNLIAMTLAVAAAVFFAPRREIAARGQTIQSTAIFTMAAAVLPLILLFDGRLSRPDGFVLILFFFAYIGWLFSRHERFSKTYDQDPSTENQLGILSQSLMVLVKIGVGVVLLLFASQGIVYSASFFAASLGLPLILIGILAVGFGNALPEVYFAVISARRGETELILGNLMGSVIFPASFILGLVTIMTPIEVGEIDSLFLSRLFLLLAAVLFWVIARTERKIVWWEGIILLLIYLVFVAGLVFSG